MNKQKVLPTPQSDEIKSFSTNYAPPHKVMRIQSHPSLSTTNCHTAASGTQVMFHPLPPELNNKLLKLPSGFVNISKPGGITVMKTPPITVATQKSNSALNNMPIINNNPSVANEEIKKFYTIPDPDEIAAQLFTENQMQQGNYILQTKNSFEDNATSSLNTGRQNRNEDFYDGTTPLTHNDNYDKENNSSLNEDDITHIDSEVESGRTNRDHGTSGNIKEHLSSEQLVDIEGIYHKEDCCYGCRNLLLTIVRKLDEIALSSVNTPQNNKKAVIEDQYTLLPMLPISNIDDLKKFDRDLVNPKNQRMLKQFETKIINFGGSDLKKAVSHILPEILTDEFTEFLTWSIRKPDKTCVSAFNFPKIISDVLRTIHSCTDSDVKACIQKWIQKSGDRIRSKNLKKK